MAYPILLVLLGLFQHSLCLPFGYNQTSSGLNGKNIGVAGQNLTYDYIVGAFFPSTSESTTLLTVH